MRSSPFACLPLALLSACNGSSTGELGVPLTLAASSPAANETGVAPDAHIVLVFSEPIEPLPLAGSPIQLFDSHGPIPFLLGMSSDHGRIELTPIPTLGLDGTITVVVGKEVKAAATGRRLAADAILTFKTRDGQWSAPAPVATATAATVPVLAHSPTGTAALGTGPSDHTIAAGAKSWTSLQPLPFGALLEPTLQFIGFDDSGNTYAGVSGTAQAERHVLVSRAPRSSPWQDPDLLFSGTPCCSSARFSSTPSGSVLVHWQQCQTGPTVCRDRMRLGTPSGQGGALQWQEVALDDGGQFPWRESAADGQGSVFVVQRVQAIGIVAHRIQPAQSAKETYALDTRVQSAWKALAIGADSQSRALALVARSEAGTSTLSAYRYLPGAGYSGETVLWQGTEDIANAKLKVSASGHAILGLELAKSGVPSRLMVSLFDPAVEAWRPLVVAESALLPAITSGVPDVYFALGIAPNGESWVVFDRINAAADADEVTATRYHAAGGPGSRKVLASGETGQHFKSLAIAADATGRATAAWTVFTVPQVPLATTSAARFE